MQFGSPLILIYHSEGDLSLTFDKDGLPIYLISFSIVPGKVDRLRVESSSLSR